VRIDSGGGNVLKSLELKISISQRKFFEDEQKAFAFGIA